MKQYKHKKLWWIATKIDSNFYLYVSNRTWIWQNQTTIEDVFVEDSQDREDIKEENKIVNLVQDIIYTQTENYWTYYFRWGEKEIENVVKEHLWITKEDLYTAINTKNVWELESNIFKLFSDRWLLLDSNKD